MQLCGLDYLLWKSFDPKLHADPAKESLENNVSPSAAAYTVGFELIQVIGPGNRVVTSSNLLI